VIDGALFESSAHGHYRYTDTSTAAGAAVIMLGLRKRPGNPPSPIVQRFAKMVDLEGENGCWLWTGRQDGKGYGSFSVQQSPGVWKTRKAHRISYELHRGRIPEGLQLDHLCRVRNCVNPDHLEPVTNRENSLRGYGACGENARKTHCPAGHPYDDTHTRLKQTQCGTIGRDCKTCGVIKAHQRAAASRTVGDHGCPLCGDVFITSRGLCLHGMKYHGVDMKKHGTRSMYGSGCRCEPCCEAVRAHGRLVTARRRATARGCIEAESLPT
jgi:hypothetical protein